MRIGGRARRVRNTARDKKSRVARAKAGDGDTGSAKLAASEPDPQLRTNIQIQSQRRSGGHFSTPPPSTVTMLYTLLLWTTTVRHTAAPPAVSFRVVRLGTIYHLDMAHVPHTDYARLLKKSGPRCLPMSIASHCPKCATANAGHPRSRDLAAACKQSPTLLLTIM